MGGYDLNKDETLITEENLTDFLDQDLAGLKALLMSKELSLDPTLDKIYKKSSNKMCMCGELLSEGPKGEYRCGSCGCIQYKDKEAK